MNVLSSEGRSQACLNYAESRKTTNDIERYAFLVIKLIIVKFLTVTKSLFKFCSLILLVLFLG